MSELTIPLGRVCHDEAGDVWIYNGYRVTTVGSHSHEFVKCLTAKHKGIGPVWTYQASNPETLFRKFPDLQNILEGLK